MHPRAASGPDTAGRVIRWARWYDLVAGKMSLGRDTLVELAAPAAGETVLDVGCGTGNLALALKAKVGTGAVHGIDASPEMIEVATHKSARAGTDVDFRVGLIETIPFPSDSLDLVTSSLMLHHLPDYLKRQGLAEVRRALKPSGRFLVMDFATESHSRRGHLFSILGHGRGPATIDRLRPMMKDAGFTRVDVVPTRHKNLVFIRAR